jgi:hypothetical protein
MVPHESAPATPPDDPTSPLPRGAVAIPNIYSGVVYRSRLEARWSVFLETLGVRALYEHEAYDLPDGTRYLPDFWLPGLATFLEVKPARPSREERQKCAALAVGTGLRVVLLEGAPGDWLGTFHTSPREFGVRYISDGTDDAPHLPCECPTCGAIDWAFEGRAAGIRCACDKRHLNGRGHAADASRIARAAAVANAVNLGVR